MKEELERLKALSELAISMKLQQLTIGDITIVPSGVAIMEAVSDPLSLESKNTTTTNDEELEEDFFPEITKARAAELTEEEELRKKAEAAEDPDLFWSSTP